MFPPHLLRRLPGRRGRVLVPLQGLQPLLDVGVHEVGDVVAGPDLRQDVAPLGCDESALPVSASQHELCEHGARPEIELFRCVRLEQSEPVSELWHNEYEIVSETLGCYSINVMPKV